MHTPLIKSPRYGSHGTASNTVMSSVSRAAAVVLVIGMFATPDLVSQQSVGRDVQMLVGRAEAYSQAGRWDSARTVWNLVVTANPYSAVGWYGLGTAEARVGRQREAVTALARYVELGGGAPTERRFFGGNAPADVAYSIATLHAQAGARDSAAFWLQRALKLGLRDPLQIGRDSALRNLWGDARFKRFAPAVPVSRVAGWQADVQYLRDEIARVHPELGERMASISRAAADLVSDSPRLSADAFVVRLQRMLKLAGAGHTGIVLQGIEQWNRALPINFETLRDTLFIVAADSAYADLVGARVLRIGQKSVSTALAAIDSLASVDNQFGVYRARMRLLRWPQVSAVLGLAPDDSTAEFEVETLRGIRKQVLVRARSNRYLDYLGGPPGYTPLAGAPGWITLDSVGTGVLPLSRRDLRNPHWFTYLPETRTVYFAFNGVVDAPGESVAQFSANLLRFIDSVGADRLIVDLRANNGGNSLLLLPLTDGIARSRVNRRGRLYVFISPYTYSAGMNAAVLLERHTQAMFVGEPTPSQPNWVGESNTFFLPYSRVAVSVSDLYWQSSWPFDQRRWIAPALYAPPTRASRIARRDPALEAVLAFPVPSGDGVP